MTTKYPLSLLIAEEESPHHITLCELLHKRKGALRFCSDLGKVVAIVQEQPVDVVIATIEKGGMGLLKAINALSNPPLVVLLTSLSCVEATVEAMQEGAFHCLPLPLLEIRLIHLLERLENHFAAQLEAKYLQKELSTHGERKKHQLIAESAPMKQILVDLQKIAKSSSSVFISGESGTGKEVIAQAIHAMSYRDTQPFIKVNCAAVPATLLESEFFGHERGAFTGALNRKQGRFELAHQGTLLLDEISEIPLELQAKLLRVVQEMEFERVGGVTPIQVDVRLVSTSNRPMKEAIEQKLFREDLYYRLNVIPIHLPPLRDRKEDILPLAEFFLNRLCEENQKPQKRLLADAKKKLLDYTWPGNIRELANVIERAIIMNPSQTLEAHQIYLDLSCSVQESPHASLPCGITLAELEKRLILQTLKETGGNRTKAAASLGISLRTLRNKLNRPLA